MDIEKATSTAGDLLALTVALLFLMGTLAAAVAFVVGASLLSWAFVTWAWSIIP